MRYVVTGGTGFIGRRVVSRLLDANPGAEVRVLVRRSSLGRFERLAESWGERAKPLVGELTEPHLGLTDEAITEVGDVDHVVHCAAIYDITAPEAEQRAANVEGTQAVIELARRLDATLHHVSSIAVAGDFHGEYTEDDFDIGQQLPTPYHQTKFEAELLVRSTTGLRYRIYRPAVVVGDSRTGEMDKIDGPYYFFGVLAKLAVLPRLTPMMLPDTGRTNIVPVDYVADAIVALLHADGHDGQTFHLTAPKTIGLRGIYRGVATAAGLPPLRGSLPTSVAAPVLKVRGRPKLWRNMVATQLGIPGEVLDVVDLAPTFVSEETQKALRGTGIAVPEFSIYAPSPVAVLGRASRSRPGPPRRPAGTAGRSARDHHRRVERHRPGGGDCRRPTRRHGFRAGPQRRCARRPGGRNSRERRPGLRLHLRCHRFRVGRTHRQGHPGPLRPRGLPGQQCRPVNPPVGGQFRPTGCTTTNG